MTGTEWLALVILLVAGVTAGAAFTLSNGAVTRAIRRLERSYRRQKALELELLQAEVVNRREREVRQRLATDPDAWRALLNQLLADAYPAAPVQVGPAGLLSLAVTPGPRLVVASQTGTLIFTTDPEPLRRVGLVGRREMPVPLDAGLHPAARVEMQAVWEHLAAQRLGDVAPVLPRQAAWFVMAQAENNQNSLKGKEKK